MSELLFENNLPVPYHWKKDTMTIFDEACFGVVPDIKGHKSDERNVRD